MFQVKPVDQNRIDIEMSGKFDSADMRSAIANLELKCEHINRGRMLYFVHDFEIPTAGAVGVELKQMPQLFHPQPVLLALSNRVAEALAPRANARIAAERNLASLFECLG